MRAEGFALFIAVARTPAARNRLMKQLADSMPGVRVHTVSVPAETVDLLDEVLRQLPDGPAGPVMLVDLEKAIPLAHDSHPVLRALNLRRPEWPEKLRQPVVLWIPEYLLGLLGRETPDFLDWRSDTVHFPDLSEADALALERLSSSWGTDDGLPLPDRQERITELRSRIKAHADSQDEAIRLARADWLLELGNHLSTLADYDEARSTLQQALAIREAILGPEHPDVATNVNNLGTVLQDLGELSEARACHERALKIDEAAFGPEHPKVATDVNNLGSVLEDLGEVAEARWCFERALKIDEAAFGPEHPEIATDVNNLGSVLQDLGQLSEARACYERALRIGEASFGPEHPRVAMVVNNLGSVLQDLGELSEARACHERALKIDEAAFGPEHPKVARDVSNLGSVLAALGELPEARACYERALVICRKRLGDDHPKTALVRKNLSGLDEPKRGL